VAHLPGERDRQPGSRPEHEEDQMPIKTNESMSGFVATTPQLTRTGQGEARMYMRVGQETWTRNPDGSHTKGESTFHDLVMFRRAAERAAERFAKGDKFVAEGRVHPYTVTDDTGQTVHREEFIARKIGHDNACTHYTVDRAPRVQQGPSNGVSAAPTAQTAPAVGM
jgi:single-stranded DNA-binding protein